MRFRGLFLRRNVSFDVEQAIAVNAFARQPRDGRTMFVRFALNAGVGQGLVRFRPAERRGGRTDGVFARIGFLTGVMHGAEHALGTMFVRRTFDASVFVRFFFSRRSAMQTVGASRVLTHVDALQGDAFLIGVAVLVFQT